MILPNASYFGITVALILTGMGLPIPEEVFVIVAGVAVQAGTLSFWPALAACLTGAIVGDCAMYAIGYHFGHGLIRQRRWFARFLTPKREKQVERMIADHGLKVLLTSRFLVGVRSPVYVTAGILRVPFRRFLLVDSICAGIVISTFFCLSILFAEQISWMWRYIHRAEIALTVVLIAAVLGVVAWFFIHRRRRWARVRLRRLRRAHRISAAAAAKAESKSVA